MLSNSSLLPRPRGVENAIRPIDSLFSVRASQRSTMIATLELARVLSFRLKAEATRRTCGSVGDTLHSSHASKAHAAHLLRLHHRALARLHEDPVRAGAALRWSDSAHAGGTVRAAQGRRHARRRQGAPLRCALALRPDERTGPLHDAVRCGAGRKGGRGGTQAARPSRVLGLTTWGTPSADSVGHAFSG